MVRSKACEWRSRRNDYYYYSIDCWQDVKIQLITPSTALHHTALLSRWNDILQENKLARVLWPNVRPDINFHGWLGVKNQFPLQVSFGIYAKHLNHFKASTVIGNSCLNWNRKWKVVIEQRRKSIYRRWEKPSAKEQVHCIHQRKREHEHKTFQRFDTKYLFRDHYKNIKINLKKQNVWAGLA